jgi:dipeptidyl aminopeptidase/acylaminoacyl peptidase
MIILPVKTTAMKQLLTFLAFCVATHATAQGQLTPELLWQLKRVGVGELTGDRKGIYYTSRTYDVATEKSSAKTYLLDITTGQRQEVTVPEGKEILSRKGSVWYAVDDSVLYSSRDGGATWAPLMEGLQGAENVQVSPDGRYVAWSQMVQVERVLGKDIYPDLPRTSAHIYTDLNYRHWDTWHDGRYAHVFVRPVAGGAAKDILEGMPYHCPQQPFGGAEDFMWSPDSKGILYVSKKLAGKAYALSTNTDIYYYDLATGTTVNRTEGMPGYDTGPSWSPDGKKIAWLSMARDGYESDKNDIYVMGAEIPGGDTLRLNLTGDWDGTVNSFAWDASGKKIYFTAPVKGTVQLFVGQLPTKKQKVAIRQITEGVFDITGIAGEAGKELVVSRCDMNHANELFAVETATGKMRQLTRENEEIYSRLKPSETRLRMVTTTDGKQMGVWVIYPPDFDSTKKYPTLLYCQGGPQSALSQFFSFRWNFRLMAAQGYIVVAPNRRGMPGWGTEWNEAISKDWGGQPMRDYLAAIDDVAREPYVDRDRMGCVGASYGGYSVFMLAGMHENRFRSFIAHDGLFDLRSWYGTTEELFFANWDIGGPYWERPQPEGYRKFDPALYVDKWNTPIMIVQGGIDFRVAIEQGLEAFQAAQLRGIKSKLLYLPNENHWVLHPQNALVWHREFFKWLDETLK